MTDNDRNQKVERLTERIAALEQLVNVHEQVALQQALRAEHAMSELGASEEKIRLIVDTALDAVVIIDGSGMITGWNAQAQEIFGWSPEEAKGQRLSDLIIPPQHRVAHEEALQMWPEVGVDSLLNKRVETTALHRSGREFPVELAVTSIRSAQGVFFSAFVRDITKRKQAEEALSKLSSAVEQTGDTVVITDRDGVIEYANRAFERLTGYSREEAIGQLPRILKSGQHDRRFYEELWATILAGRSFRATMLNRKKDGQLYYEEKTITPLKDAQDRITHFVATGKDVTELKRTEEELRLAKNAAEAANRTKSDFLAKMSHELRTPMNAIIGYSEMLTEEAEEQGQDTFVPDLRKITAAGKHLLALINDILDLSKIEAGKMELYIERFNVREIVGEVVTTIQPLAKKNSNSLEIQCSDDVGFMVADITKVRQILFNLLSNACKFTRQGVITLAVNRQAQDRTNWMIFRVADSGIGMTGEQLDRVFEAFVQADTSITRKFGGTGLGLAITRHFCKMMDGEITVESEPSKGATFTVRLPVNVVDRGTEQPAVTSSVIGQRELREYGAAAGTVLVIDDDPVARDLVHTFLTKEGYRVMMASSGQEGIKLARESHPDVITLDVLMPGMDGWAVLSALKADRELAKIPVILLTIVDDKNMGYALGASEYITKPIDRERMALILRKYVRERTDGLVLVVEDDAGAREMMRQMLEREGYAVIEAENGRVALERAAEKPPDLILLDLMMPGMDGFQFIEAFRKDQARQSIPVVVITAKDLTAQDRLRLSGYVETILQKKSFGVSGLLDEVRDLVRTSLCQKKVNGT